MNVCLLCNPGGGGKVLRLNEKVSTPSVYIGETGRSLYERGREHWQGYREGREGNHILKHHVLHHQGQGEPKFHLRPLHYHQTALNRQLTEAVKIGRFGEDNLLNSKGEFNRSHITRLTLGDKVDGKKDKLVKATDGKDDGQEVPAATERKTTGGKVKEDDLEGKADRRAGGGAGGGCSL